MRLKMKLTLWIFRQGNLLDRLRKKLKIEKFNIYVITIIVINKSSILILYVKLITNLL
jgi:hypothetical protein